MNLKRRLKCQKDLLKGQIIHFWAYNDIKRDYVSSCGGGLDRAIKTDLFIKTLSYLIPPIWLIFKPNIRSCGAIERSVNHWSSRVISVPSSWYNQVKTALLFPWLTACMLQPSELCMSESSKRQQHITFSNHKRHSLNSPEPTAKVHFRSRLWP